MIPLAKRSARKLETTLLSYSRQSLPRPYRLYTTPTKSAHAQALPASSVLQGEAPLPYLPPSLERELSKTKQMTGYLHEHQDLTILPTPLPADSEDAATMIFPDTTVQNTISIVEACVHNLHDVPRARTVFERLRRTHKGDSTLHAGLYNTMLDAYIEMATTKQPERRSHWVEDACALYEVMETGKDKVNPTANTYAIMLRAWVRFNPSQQLLPSTVDMPTPIQLLRAMIDRQIPASLVVADRAIKTSDEATEAIKHLSKAAVEMNLSKVVNELGMAEVFGTQIPDALDDVPEAKPVMKAKKQEEVRAIHAADGSVTDIDVPELMPHVEQEVPFNLENLRKHLAQVVLARRVLPEDVAARQKLLEESVYDVAVERLKRQAELFDEIGLAGKGLGNNDLRKWMWEWHQKLKERVRAETALLIMDEQKFSTDKQHTRLSPFLSLLSPEKLSLITILELMNQIASSSESRGIKIARALLSVGKAVEIEYKAEMCKKNNISIPANTARGGEHGYFSRLGYRDLHARRVAAARYMEDAEEWTSEWSQVVRVKVGAFLVDLLMDVATVVRTAMDRRTGDIVTEEQPAFVHSYEYQRGRKLGVITLNSMVVERIAKDSVRETLHPRHLPMLVKPKPWLGHNEGGYLYNKVSVMRYKESTEQQIYLRQASNLGNVELVYAALDVLGTTPWQINRDVFEIVLKVWNSGERFHKIPPVIFDKTEPVKPDNSDFDPKAKAVYLTRMKAYQNDRANNHSDRCNVNYKVEIARTFLGDTFYFPHNVDFRGRAYPLPPHLNHIGDDLSRGLLKFGESRPLGERGLRWLKIHISNLYGYDKASFDDRVAFVDQHLPEIYDSAEKPLEGGRWWTKADDAWQCLAACMELRNALESGDPHAYESNLPIHQDGTCNGLQHYAALGGDDQGARQVNLDVTDKPSDVYTYVANMVEDQIAKDVKKDDPYAKLLSGKIARKVVKQTVMTTVYGVTFIGAREQIERQLKDRGDIPIEECWNAAAYLAKVTLACIGDLFSSAKEIQTWLNTCAKLIAKSIPPERLAAVTVPAAPPKDKRRSKASSQTLSARVRKEQMTSVIWTTPLGLPIVQPYRQERRKQIMTSLQTVFLSDPNSPAAVNPTKQATAFPPNFVHSLDATHMMLTALECRTRNITFASVHDSYWTHAAAVDEMSVIIRETFIGLHSSNVLQRLSDEFKERYKGYKVSLASITTLLPRLSKIGKIHKVEEGKVQELAATEVKDLLEKAQSIAIEAEASLDAEAQAELDEDYEEEETPKKRGRKGIPMEDRFVDITELLPPVPKKGVFDVDRVKNSLYFFS